MTEKTEMRIYEFLGVKFFRKLVFSLEKLIHRRDHGLNINYHIPRIEVGALDAFIKYLFYNGMIHARNIVFFVFYLLLKILFRWDFKIFDIILSLLAVKDIYCVMLQRYNMLRIRYCKEILLKRRERKKEQNIEKLKKHFDMSYDHSYAAADLALLKRIKASIENRENIVLSSEDIVALKRLTDIKSCNVDNETNNMENTGDA